MGAISTPSEISTPFTDLLCIFSILISSSFGNPALLLVTLSPPFHSPLKASTGITGLAVHPNPLPALLETYRSTESVLSKMPNDSVYRQATSAILKYRTSVIEKSAGDVAKVEQELDAGQIEEVLEAAKDELKLAGNVLEWKP